MLLSAEGVRSATSFAVRMAPLDAIDAIVTTVVVWLSECMGVQVGHRICKLLKDLTRWRGKLLDQMLARRRLVNTMLMLLRNVVVQFCVADRTWTLLIQLICMLSKFHDFFLIIRGPRLTCTSQY